MHLEEQHNKDLIQTEELKPTNTELTGSIPPGIGNLTYLENLSLWNNQLSGEIPPEVCELLIVGCCIPRT